MGTVNPFKVIQISVLLFLGPISFAQITVREVMERIQQEVTCDWQSETVDNLKTGQIDQEVTGIATTFLATLAVLKKAVAQNVNLIITHEPTFYNHFDDQEKLAQDPVQKAKLKYIKDHKLAIFRFHDHLHQTEPDIVATGLTERLRWNNYLSDKPMQFDIPQTTLKQVAQKLEEEFNNSAVRVVGDPSMSISKIGIVPGAYGSYAQIAMLNQPGVEAIIVGETREWETVEYARDAHEAGFKKALIIMGHADSEEDGMEKCKDWLSGFIKEVPIRFIPAGNPLWSPE